MTESTIDFQIRNPGSIFCYQKYYTYVLQNKRTQLRTFFSIALTLSLRQVLYWYNKSSTINIKYKLYIISTIFAI